MIDPKILSDQARMGVVPILEAVLAKGVSLYGGDRNGGLVEIAPDGREYEVEIQERKPVRVREITNEHSREISR